MKRPVSKPTNVTPLRRAKPAAKQKLNKPTKAPKAPKETGKRLAIASKVASRRNKASSQAVLKLSDFRSGSKLKRYSIISTLVAFGLLLALIGAAVFSPILSVQKIIIRGNDLVSTKALKKTLEGEIGKPLPQVSQTHIAGLLKKYTLIESFSAISAPPHTLIIRVVERTPIAIVYKSGAFYYFDPAGVQIGKATATDKLPVLDIKGVPAKSETYAAAIDVLLALPAKMLSRIALVTAKSTDNVTFRLRGYAGQKVVWGDKSNAALKSKVLSALIANQGSNDRVTYDVSSPAAPTVRY
jgi:cell division protein FtsQ